LGVRNDRLEEGTHPDRIRAVAKNKPKNEMEKNPIKFLSYADTLGMKEKKTPCL
jgi:hypothetical protein